MTWLKSLNLRQKRNNNDDEHLMFAEKSNHGVVRRRRRQKSSDGRTLSCKNDDENIDQNSRRQEEEEVRIASNQLPDLVSSLDEHCSSSATPTTRSCQSRLMASNNESEQSARTNINSCQAQEDRRKAEDHYSSVSSSKSRRQHRRSNKTSGASQSKMHKLNTRIQKQSSRFVHRIPSPLINYLALLLITALAVVAGASSQPQQYFEVQPEQSNSISVGQDVRLRCLVRNRQGECAWIRNGQVIGPIKSKYSYQRQPEDGDCSLLIRNSSVQLDDGQWQCQVLATELDQPSLQSRQVQLLVLVPPEKPQFKDLQQGAQKLVIEENNTKFVVCEIRGGNPSPQIDWFLDGKNITKEAQTSIIQQATTSPLPIHLQKVTQSRLKLADIKRTQNGKNLTCVGVHQTLNQSASVELDVQYVPTVSVGQREYSIVEGSPLSISCQVDANPAPTLINWRLVSEGPPTLTTTKSRLDSKSGSSAPPAGQQLQPISNGPVLEFQHIDRNSNQDIYECLAQNQHGISQPVGVKLNVLFAPAVLNSSQSPESVSVGANAQLQCLFEGNPEPEIRWFYTDPLSKSAAVLQLDNDKRSSLVIKNVTYRNEGDYFCEAKNYINGQFYSVRSSNILLDIFGEPQFLLKSPQNAKAVQGSKSDVSLKFCSDPPPHKIYWQFGSIRLDVRLNGQQQQQLTPPGVGQMSNGKQQPMSVLQRFHVQPLQAIQRKDSYFSKVQTCFEASLTLLDPELTDQRDYTLNVFNERGHQSGTIRLRVSSPLSPVLMISSAFLTICALFLCSLLFVFVFKKKHQQEGGAFLNGAGGRRRSPANGTSNGANEAGRGSQRSANGTSTRSEKLVGAPDLNGKMDGSTTTTTATNGHINGQQQQAGLVNGIGNGLANGASNPVNSGDGSSLDCESAISQELGSTNNKQGKAGADLSQQQQQQQLMSMASSSDTSCNDQKQLLANCSDRNSATSSNNSSSLNHHHHQLHLHHLQQQQQHRLHHQQNVADDMAPFNHHHSASQSTDRSTANSTPSPLNHISVDDELNLNVTYQATESVTRGAQLSPMRSANHNQNGANNGGLIYANLDSFSSRGGGESPSSQQMTLQRMSNSYQRPSLRRQQQQQSINGDQNQQQPSPDSSIASSQHQQQYSANVNNNSQTTAAPMESSRPSVGATIAMMNSLAAAAAAAAPAQSSPISSPSSGVLNGAINQQLAMNNQRSAAAVVRKPGPPKPPKPSIQQRSRFYQQQVVNNNNTTNGLVMIQKQQQQSEQQQQLANNADQLAIEYSKIAFPARADL